MKTIASGKEPELKGKRGEIQLRVENKSGLDALIQSKSTFFIILH